MARYARCCLRQVGYWRDEGMPFLKLGQMVRFEPLRVIAWLSEHEHESAAQPAQEEAQQ